MGSGDDAEQGSDGAPRWRAVISDKGTILVDLGVFLSTPGYLHRTYVGWYKTWYCVWRELVLLGGEKPKVFGEEGCGFAIEVEKNLATTGIGGVLAVLGQAKATVEANNQPIRRDSVVAIWLIGGNVGDVVVKHFLSEGICLFRLCFPTSDLGKDTFEFVAKPMGSEPGIKNWGICDRHLAILVGQKLAHMASVAINCDTLNEDMVKRVTQG